MKKFKTKRRTEAHLQPPPLGSPFVELELGTEIVVPSPMRYGMGGLNPRKNGAYYLGVLPDARLALVRVKDLEEAR